MARPNKIGVDYFQHDVHQGKTLFTLQQLHGNDGYAFWFKLLELLGAQEGLCYSCADAAGWLYLLAHTGVSEEKGAAILALLADLGAIDAPLWKQRVIWSQNFADRLREVYRKRCVPLPSAPVCAAKTKAAEGSRAQNPPAAGPSAPEKEGKAALEQRFAAFWKQYARKVNKAEARERFFKIAPSEALFSQMMETLRAYCQSWRGKEMQFIPHAATWLHQKRYLDNPEDILSGGAPPPQPLPSDLDFLQ